MKYRELVRRLRELNCEFVREAPGSHEIWWNPLTRRFTVIPRHAGKDLPRGTLRAILRNLGLKLRPFPLAITRSSVAGHGSPPLTRRSLSRSRTRGPRATTFVPLQQCVHQV